LITDFSKKIYMYIYKIYINIFTTDIILKIHKFLIKNKRPGESFISKKISILDSIPN